MMNIAVFCSGNGSNFQAIADSVRRGEIAAKIALMVCDNPKAFALARAKKLEIKSLLIERKNFKTKEEFEAGVIRNLEKESIELICLAGFMRLISPGFVQRYRNKILNIHPALLPAFKGTRSIKDALGYGVKVTGVTVHLVDEKTDHGPIILQKALEIKENDTEESLAGRIHEIEHELYPQAIKLFVEGKLNLAGRRAKIE
ncbi:MAG: phosphoribosylglycinamide formyltransferase [Candidatus Omnitrophica bacterium]|nr:phosphoribosylglycinamide formyltransferase [Candidatus Omnitrophota bacterium]MBU3934196.1 phosphoribosylglycinamide formyltransferase [Candidatus Omnitrophota bacterium]MBU4140396.1 phosphoribosylglycinamide formyltransferase [Candidatus Omnitrophota bacterium]